MRRLLSAAAVTISTALSTSAFAAQAICVVADPTGTPLNIRIQPNGEIVDTVRNGTRVQVFLENAMTDSRGQIWHNIALPTSGGPDGYVLARYLRCP